LGELGRRAVLLSTAIVVSAGCGATTQHARLTIFADSAIAPTLKGAVPTAHVVVGPSADLERRIARGARPDLFIASDLRYAAGLYRAHLIQRPRILVADQVVLVVGKRLRKTIRSPRDLAQPGIRIAMAPASSPLASYTAQELRQVLGTRRARWRRIAAPTARSLVRDVAAGRADAAFVYTSDLGVAGNAVRAIYPAIANPAYVFALPERPVHRHAADALIRTLLGRSFQRRLLHRGFVTTGDAGQSAEPP
jgi:ABC-type molybdate transport system substrate-binding protein